VFIVPRRNKVLNRIFSPESARLNDHFCSFICSFITVFQVFSGDDRQFENNKKARKRLNKAIHRLLKLMYSYVA